MQAAIDQNTKGVILLTSGFHHAAVKCFKNALNCVRNACNTLTPSGTDNVTGALQRPGTVRFERRLSEDIRSHSYFIHAATDGSYESYTLCSALIMFNLGVAFHYHGYITDSRPEKCLKSAGMLYSHCLQLMSMLPDDFDEEKIQISSVSLRQLVRVCHMLGDGNGARCASDGLLILSVRNSVVDQDYQVHDKVAPAA
jgi:hypothetical protein